MVLVSSKDLKKLGFCTVQSVTVNPPPDLIAILLTISLDCLGSKKSISIPDIFPGICNKVCASKRLVNARFRSNSYTPASKKPTMLNRFNLGITPIVLISEFGIITVTESPRDSFKSSARPFPKMILKLPLLIELNCP